MLLWETGARFLGPSGYASAHQPTIGVWERRKLPQLDPGLRPKIGFGALWV